MFLSAIFTKGNNFCDFLFAFLDDNTLLSEERICSHGSEFFLKMRELGFNIQPTMRSHGDASQELTFKVLFERLEKRGIDLLIPGLVGSLACYPLHNCYSFSLNS